MTKRLIFLFLLLPMLSLWGRAQGVDAILKIVEQNNKDLQALRKDTEASSLEIRSRNLPLSDGPSVEYSPFLRKGAGRMASSELVVSQGFDFPALQTARAKQGRLERQELTRQYAIQRRDILLQAKMCCLDLVYQNQQYKLLTRRKNVAKHLQELTARRMSEGDATQIDLNKIKIDLMNIETALTQVKTEQLATLQTLQSLSGGERLTLADTTYTPFHDGQNEDDEVALTNRILSTDCDVLSAQAAVQTAEGKLRTAQREWLPKMEIGYRRNTEMSETSHGFLIGATLPLYGQRNRTKIARAQQDAAQLRLEQTRNEAHSRILALLNQVRALQEMRRTFDKELIRQTLILLQRSVEEGQMSVINYYIEADALYQNMATHLEVERQYQGLWAEINKNDL